MSSLRNIAGTLFLICFLFSASPALAQFDLDITSRLPQFGQVSPGVGGIFSGLNLRATPLYPEPFEDYELELSSPSQATAGALIRWYIDGTEDMSARNKRNHSLTAKGLGEVTSIRVVLEKLTGGTEETSLTIKPTQIDMIIEGKTTVPDFYNGRAVPSKGAGARATAILHTGSTVNQSGLVYRWELNGNVLEGGAIRGLQTVDFTMPLNGESFLKVTISDANGPVVERSFKIFPAQPQILFYQENPLYGTGEVSINRELTLAGNQVTVRAEPFYLSPYLNKPDYLIEWNIGSQRINTSGSEDPTIMVLRGDGTNSSAGINIRMADMGRLSLPVSNSFRLNFSF